MGFFRRKAEEPVCFASPLDGELLPLCEVNDEAFASGMLGTGFAINPTNSVLYMPFDGEVTMIFPTKHAVALKDRKGHEFLIHIGIDTVTMEGEGFVQFTEAGKKVKAGEKLIGFPMETICEKGLDPVVMIVKASQDDDPFELNEHKTVCVSEKLMEL